MTGAGGPVGPGGWFDVVVVGRGLIGSAAGRHLAESGRRVVMVGPDEPTDWAAWNGPFSSHGDQGRITRLSDRDPVWAEVAHRSIDRYPDLEARSGIDFHRPCGLVVSAPDLERWIAGGRAVGAAIEPVDPARLAATTGITLPEGAPAAVEAGPAGRIDPRRLVAAQTALARRAGAEIIAEAATSLAPTSLAPTSPGRPGSAPDVGFTVGGPWGSVRARRVLVATGAFGHGLIDHRPPVIRRPRTVVLAEVSGVRHDPDGLPCLILRTPDDQRLSGLYWVPPVLYPDGRTWLKIGGSLLPEPTIGTGPDPDAELVSWFHGPGDPNEAQILRRALEALLPTMTIGATRTVPCVYTGTPSGRPIIDWLDDGLAVAVGGNGAAAKSSDELGRLAASLVSDDRALGPGPEPAVFGLAAQVEGG